MKADPFHKAGVFVKWTVRPWKVIFQKKAVTANAILFISLLVACFANAREPIPDKLVVLTFDDASKSHFTRRPAAPAQKYKFGATFFVTEGLDFPTNKKDYMTWDEIAQLHKDGFEIGNHTRDHKARDATRRSATCRPRSRRSTPGARSTASRSRSASPTPATPSPRTPCRS